MLLNRLITLIVLICTINIINSELNEKRSEQHKHDKNVHRHRRRRFKNETIKVAIGHKQYAVNGPIRTNSRNSRVSNIPDNWDKIPYLFQTYNEPDPETDKYYQMPVLSNGFLGTSAKNNSVYLNGMYSGLQGRSHRVRIPSMTAIDAYISTESLDTKTCSLDCRKGAYITETITPNAIISQRFFVHRRLKNIIINEIRVQLTNRQTVSVTLYNFTRLVFQKYTQDQFNNRYPEYILENGYDNITFEHRVIKQPSLVNPRLEANDGINYLRATIYEPEVSGKQLKQIHTYYTNIPSQLIAFGNSTNGVKYFHFIQSVDIESSRAQKAYEDAVRMIQQDPPSLFVSHVAAWEEIWQRGGMAMLSEPSYSENNQEALKYAQRLYSSFYNIYSAIPMSSDSQFYGVSPAGLGYGSLKAEFFNNTVSATSGRQISEGNGGKIMYSQEFWMLPLVSLFNTDMSKNLIQSRLRRGYNTDSLNVFEKAREWAKNENYQGLRYAWEQGDFGDEVSSLQDAKQKIHTGASISFGIRNYLKTVQPREFLLQSISSEIPFKGEDYILELAKYWYERLQLDTLTNKFGINGVSFGEIQRTKLENNEAFTNYMAAQSLDTYKYALMLTDKNPYDAQFSYITKDYDEKINKLKMPYDEARQLLLEYDNYNNAYRNDETFVPFLNYPILKQISYNQKKTLLDTYQAQLPNDGKNMPGYASFLVGYMELNEDVKAKEYLARLSNHFNGPFQVASEYPQTGGFVNTNNIFNYLPGYAAFAQAFIGGFCGIRMQDFQLDVVYPSEFYDKYQTSINSGFANPIFKPPALNSESWNITGLNYFGNKLDFIYSLKSKSLEIRNRRSQAGSSSGEEMLEIIVYEGAQIIQKPLRIDETIKINISPDTWDYFDRTKNREIKKFRNDLYSDNMHILASIYPINKVKFLQKSSNSNRLVQSSSLIILLITIMLFIFSQDL